MRAYLPVAIWMALIFIVSSAPNPPAQGGGDARAYAAHFSEYAILAFLVARGLGLERPRWHYLVVVAVAIVISASYGLSDEWHQSFVPRRDASLMDAGFDAMGALAGALVWALVVGLRRGRLSPRSA